MVAGPSWTFVHDSDALTRQVEERGEIQTPLMFHIHIYADFRGAAHFWLFPRGSTSTAQSMRIKNYFKDNTWLKWNLAGWIVQFQALHIGKVQSSDLVPTQRYGQHKLRVCVLLRKSTYPSHRTFTKIEWIETNSIFNKLLHNFSLSCTCLK